MKIPKVVKARESYLLKIQPFMRKSVVKVLTGHRRAGKSYILYQLIAQITKTEKEASIIYLNKEDVAFDSVRNYSDLNDYVLSKSKDDQMNYIFIDEIQEIADFRLAIRSLALDENNDIYITGSNSEIFSSDLANFLGGRYVEFQVHSLSYLEFLTFHSLPNDDTSLEKFIHFGGLPYLIHLPPEEPVVNEYLKSIYAAIVLKDVVRRKKIRNVAFLEQLIKFLASGTGSLFSSKSVSDFLKSQQTAIAPNQVNEYAMALSEAFIIHRVGRYDIDGKRLFERGEKYYFEDMGIRNVVAGYSPKDRAKRIENVAFNHLLFCGYEVKVGTIYANEVDFVCTKNGETLYVQVSVELSREETIEREFGNLLKIKDNYPKIVVSAEKSFENSYEGIEHVYIRDFLSSDGSYRINRD
ncbi:MAG: ATP-binding protein [Prevotellaceae bacterium]|jgi:predicted AAA+ superfamily ATPase|nr:ATP-binding protein [Prevotellaceae bacterium]